LATFDQTDLEYVREWLSSIEEGTEPGVKDVYEMLKNHVADDTDVIKLIGNDGVTDLLY
jgi:uncharacterized NAD-dependent epimerase/dehydratase family protein